MIRQCFDRCCFSSSSEFPQRYQPNSGKLSLTREVGKEIETSKAVHGFIKHEVETDLQVGLQVQEIILNTLLQILRDGNVRAS